MTVAAEAVRLPDAVSLLRARGYIAAGERFSTGRPGRTTLPFVSDSGLPVVVKLFPPAEADLCWSNMRELWRSSFGEGRRPPGLPRPIELVEEIDAVVIERLPGRPLLERGEPDEQATGRAMRLAAGLHESDARPPRRRSADRILRSLSRKGDRVAVRAPALAPAIRAVIAGLKGRIGEEPELVPCHGDFSPRNVMLTPQRDALIDWDRFQLADPARDVAYFGTWCWAQRVRRREERSWSVLESAVRAYDALRPAARVRERLPFHVAAGLVRIADGIVVLWPEEIDAVPAVTGEALRILEAAR